MVGFSSLSADQAAGEVARWVAVQDLLDAFMNQASLRGLFASCYVGPVVEVQEDPRAT